MQLRCTLALTCEEPAFSGTVLPKLSRASGHTGHDLDELVVELVPGFARPFRAYYADEGPPLREMFSRQELALLDRLLVRALKPVRVA